MLFGREQLKQGLQAGLRRQVLKLSIVYKVTLDYVSRLFCLRRSRKFHDDALSKDRKSGIKLSFSYHFSYIALRLLLHDR